MSRILQAPGMFISGYANTYRKNVFSCFCKLTFPRKNPNLFVMALIKREILTSLEVSYTKRVMHQSIKRFDSRVRPNLYHVTKFSTYFPFTLCWFYTKISSFMPVLTIGVVRDCFYLLIFYSEKFSTWVWRLPFAVNENLSLSNINPPTMGLCRDYPMIRLKYCAAVGGALAGH